MFSSKYPLFLFDSGLVPKFCNLFLWVSADSFAHPALWCERNVTVTHQPKFNNLLSRARTRAYYPGVYCFLLSHLSQSGG